MTQDVDFLADAHNIIAKSLLDQITADLLTIDPRQDPVALSQSLEAIKFCDNCAQLRRGEDAPILSLAQQRFNWNNHDRWGYQLRIDSIRNQSRRDVSTGKTRKAVFEDYVALIKDNFDIKRCLLREEGMVFDDMLGKWVPALNKIDILKSIASDGQFYSPGKMEVHLRRYISELEPRLLCEIPQWDKRDRIKELADALILNNMSNENAEQLLKDWAAKMVRRIYAPTTRNRILVLKGDQNIGKDWFIDAFVGGLEEGDYVQNLSFNGQDREAERRLHKAIVFKISEFDRTAKVAVGQLKHLITTPTTDERLPYDRADEKRFVRCSYIASCNVDDILRDYTGNTRFMILDVERIKFTYPGAATDEDRMLHRKQILAQAFYLADSQFFADHEANKANAIYVEQRSPEDPLTVLAEWFNNECNKLADASPYDEFLQSGFISNARLMALADDGKRKFGLEITHIRNRLSALGLRARKNYVRGYEFKRNKSTETDQTPETISGDQSLFF